MTEEHVSLRDYIESLFTSHKAEHTALESHRVELRDLLSAALDGVAVALQEYKTVNNEWRQQLADEREHFADKAALKAATEKVEAAVATLSIRVDELRVSSFMQAGSRAKGLDYRTVMLALAGLSVSAVGIGLGLVVALR